MRIGRDGKPFEGIAPKPAGSVQDGKHDFDERHVCRKCAITEYTVRKFPKTAVCKGRQE